MMCIDVFMMYYDVCIMLCIMMYYDVYVLWCIMMCVCIMYVCYVIMMIISSRSKRGRGRWPGAEVFS